MCTQYVHLGSNTLCNLTKKCIRAYAQKAAELKPKLAEFIEYHQEKSLLVFLVQTKSKYFLSDNNYQTIIIRENN